MRRLGAIAQHVAASAAEAPKAPKAGDAAAGLKDEYRNMDDAGETYVHQGAFELESGQSLESPEVRYKTWGELSPARDNCVFVCHALTGNANLESWWGELLGEGKAFDPKRHFIVCANVLGSCYGSTGPNKIDKRTGQRYGGTFPLCSIRDTVRLHGEMVQRSLGVTKVQAAIGGSMGGMQALEWGLIWPKLVRSLVVIGCGAKHTAWQIAISETQRQAIYTDRKWQGGHFNPADPPVEGLAVARQIAMVSYRTAKAFERKFSRRTQEEKPESGAASGSQQPASCSPRRTLSGTPLWETRTYLEYQGKKFHQRGFDAVTYVRLTEQMDTHDVGRGRGGCDAALKGMDLPITVIGIDSDVLYPLPEQEHLHSTLPKSRFETVRSDEGHDGFMLEGTQVGAAILRHFEQLAQH